MDLSQNAEKKGAKIMQIRLTFVEITCILKKDYVDNFAE